jgi:diaminopimelate epimerase
MGARVNTAIRSIPFVKASACGNDFLLIDGTLAPEDVGAFTRSICDRHDGVGADGVEWMSRHFSADLEIRLINADGSPAEISGNGTRCAAAYFCSQYGKERISVLTGAGTKICALTARRDLEYEFEIEMGDAVVAKELQLRLATGEVRGIPVSMGNPHFVVFAADFPANWPRLAAEIQRDAHFAQGVNVEFAIADSNYDLRVRFYERGVGETRSSGTGSCASAAAAFATGRAKSPLKVHAPGGTQIVREQGNKLFLRGPARLVCQGEYWLR